MRSRFVAGNWKMNLSKSEGVALTSAIAEQKFNQQTEVVVCAPHIYLDELSKIAASNAQLHVGAQNCHFAAKGAYTGEISAGQLKSVGVEYVILGHSERRTYFGETNEMLKDKVDAVFAEGLKVIFCCGEVLEERESGKQAEVVKVQLQEALGHLDASSFKDLVIAYEPVWAIGTGKTATSDQAQDMHKMIREWVAEQFGQATADTIHILYGGSCKPTNAAELFAQEDVDGGLIGGASLKAEDFLQIINA